MLFDTIISNPPFNSNSDLAILASIYKLGNKICFVHPATWLFAKKPTNSYSSIKKLVAKDFSHFEVVENSNELFHIQIFVDCSINLFHKNHGSIDVDGIDVHGDSPIYKSIKKKILSYCKTDNVQKRKLNNCNKEWEVGIASIRAHPKPCSDVYTMTQKVDPAAHIGKSGTIKYWQKFEFDTKSECKHFVEYLMLKLTRFCLSIYKINQHQDSGELASVPYMPTYTRPWTDEEVAIELGLTDEELAWAINWIPDYYTEDAEKYAKYKNIE